MLKKFRFSFLNSFKSPFHFPPFKPLLFTPTFQSRFSTITDPSNPNDPPSSNPKIISPPPRDPPNTNNENNVPPNNEDYQVKLETFILESRKFELSKEEELLPKKTFVFFSSGQSALAKNNTNVTFDLGSLSESNLDYDIAFFMQLGDSSNKIYRIGMILDHSVNKNIKKELKKIKKSREEPHKLEKTEETPPSSPKNSITTALKLKDKGNRVKIVEIQINSEGILATCIPYKDIESSDLESNKPIIISPTTAPESEAKNAFPLHNELNRIYSLINIIKIYLGYDKISAFENSFFVYEKKEEMTADRIDELMIRILAEIDKIGRFLKDDFQFTSQVFIESRSLILRVLFIRRKLEKIWESLEIVNRNFKIVDDNIKKLEMLNKAKMCLDLINYSAEKKKEDGVSSGVQSHQPLWKKYMDKLNLIEDLPSKEKIKKEIERFQQLERNSGEYHKISTYLDEVFSIPWDKFSEPYWNVKSTNKILEKNIYGLDKVK